MDRPEASRDPSSRPGTPRGDLTNASRSAGDAPGFVISAIQARDRAATARRPRYAASVCATTTSGSTVTSTAR